jgi:hypothetical protein
MNRIIRAALLYFVIVFGVGFVLGAIRVPVVVPRLGERAAELAETPLMFVAIVLAAGYVVRRYAGVIANGAWLWVGGVALTAMVAAELLLAVALAGRSVGEYIRSRDPVSGSVYLVMLVVFALMPWLRRGATRMQAHTQADRESTSAPDE